MKPFTYERPQTPTVAAAAAVRTPDAKFIAGGTNLLDLMKLEIETPRHLIDVNALGLDKIEPTPQGGLRIGALVRNTDLAADERVRRDYAPSCRAQSWLALRASFVTRPQRLATYSSARAALISTTPTCRAISASRAAAAPQSGG